MKNVPVKISLFMTLFIGSLSIGFVAKYWAPLREFVKSHSETKTPQVGLQKSQTKSSKVFLKEAILAQRTEIENCYDAYLKRDPRNVNGSILVKWILGANGNVQSPSIADSEIDDLDLKNCVIEQVSAMSFDPQKFEENMQFSYRFHFKARAPAAINFE